MGTLPAGASWQDALYRGALEALWSLGHRKTGGCTTIPVADGT